MAALRTAALGQILTAPNVAMWPTVASTQQVRVCGGGGGAGAVTGGPHRLAVNCSRCLCTIIVIPYTRCLKSGLLLLHCICILTVLLFSSSLPQAPGPPRYCMPYHLQHGFITLLLVLI